jgi:16S rRNA (guanine(966)-N(2))-methyltransferase RsmD
MSGLKIIGGEARGRNLKTLPEDDLSVRPILGRIKKSLFDILRPRLIDARFLDLFAGTGAVGLEALSRGCAFVTFVEMSPRSIALIEANLALLGWQKRAAIHRADVSRGLAGVGAPFNVIFMGPPYKDQDKRPLALTVPALRAILSAGCLAADGWIVCQHHDKEPVTPPEGLTQFRRERYGDTLLTFFRKTDAA